MISDDEYIKIGDTVTPVSWIRNGLWLMDIPADGNYYQERNEVCLFEGKGKVLKINKFIIDYNEWSEQDRINGFRDFGRPGKVEYTNLLIECDAGIGWHALGAVTKVVEQND